MYHNLAGIFASGKCVSLKSQHKNQNVMLHMVITIYNVNIMYENMQCQNVAGMLLSV